MSTYETLLWLHVSFAVLWVGGAIMLAVLGAKISQGSPDERVYYVAQLGWFSPRYFAPISLLTLIFGIWLAIDGDWDLSVFWISAAFAVFLLSFIIGAGYLGPTSAKAARRAGEHGADDPQAQVLVERVMWVARLDTFLLLFVIYLMTTKPGGG